MPKSIAAKHKRLGRPATGHDTIIGLRLASELTKKVDAWAAAHKTTRSDAIRQFIKIALNKSPRLRRKKQVQQSPRIELVGDPVVRNQDACCDMLVDGKPMDLLVSHDALDDSPA